MRDYQFLVDEAYKAQENAYVPYSHFKVGAAVLLKNGKIIPGCNIENASYSLTMCAERNAIFSTYAQGYRQEDIEALAIVGDGPTLITPCGSCRQVLSELLNKETPIVLGDRHHYEIAYIDELLPGFFSKEDM